MNTSTHTSTENRAISLLGQGISPAIVAATLGVSESRISQLVSDPNRAQEIVELRFKSMAKHSERDGKYDTLEDELLEKLKDLIPLMMRPLEVLKALATLNGAKRRSTSAPEALTNQSTVVPLILPMTIIKQFTMNVNNQVIKAGDQDLITAQSGALDGFVRELLPPTKQPPQKLENSHHGSHP